MKTHRLIIACAIGIVSATPALAEFVEGSLNLEQLRAQPSVAQPASTVGDGQYEGHMFSQLAMQHQVNAQHRSTGVAGRSGDDIDMGSRGDAARSPDESIYDQIQRTYN